MSNESREKHIELDQEKEKIKEEIGLIVRKAESMINIIETQENENIFDRDPAFKKQLLFIRDSLKTIRTKITKDYREKIRPDTNLNHELGNVEVYFKYFDKIKQFQSSGKDFTLLLKVLKEKIDYLYSYLADITENSQFFENEITSDTHYEKAA